MEKIFQIATTVKRVIEQLTNKEDGTHRIDVMENYQLQIELYLTLISIILKNYVCINIINVLKRKPSKQHK